MRSHIFRKSCDTAPLNEYMEDSAPNEILYWISVTLLKAAEPEKSPFRCLKKCPELQLRRPPHAAYFLRFDDPKKYKICHLFKQGGGSKTIWCRSGFHFLFWCGPGSKNLLSWELSVTEINSHLFSIYIFFRYIFFRYSTWIIWSQKTDLRRVVYVILFNLKLKFTRKCSV